MRLLIIISVLIIIISNSIWAQTKIEKYSFNPKIGVSYNVATKPWFTYGLAFNVIGKKNLYSTYYKHNAEMEMFGSKDPKETLNDFGIMLGRYIGERYFRFEYQFGLSVFWGVNRGEQTYSHGYVYQYESENYSTIGLPLKLGIKVVPFKFMSIGLDFQANINFESSIFMALLSLEFGLLRNEIEPRPID